MASIIVNQGLRTIGARASDTGDSENTSTGIESMSVDDSSNAFTATDTALNTGGAVANEADSQFDETPTSVNQTFSHTATFGTGVANFTIRRIALHNDTSANVSTSSTTLVGGIDGQSITKTSDFSVTITVDITYTDNS